MRKLLIPLMAASMLVPAAANAEDGAILRGMRNQVERSSRNENRSDNRSPASQSSQRVDRSNDDRPARVERMSRPERQSRPEHLERADGGDRNGGSPGRIERAWRSQRGEQQADTVQSPAPAQNRQQTERRHEGLVGGFSRVGRDMADGRTDDGDNDRDWRRIRDGRSGDTAHWRRDHDGRHRWSGDGRNGDTDHWHRDRDGRHRWSGDWRRDHRYDWRSYRNRYGWLFRLGRYHDPYGWGYRRFSIGFDLWPSYYGSSFWLNDPWQYRLPPAYGPYRWIRYYDDALLVNIYTGQVVDVVHNVFW